MGYSNLPAYFFIVIPQLKILDQLISRSDLDIPEATPFRLSRG